MKFGDDQLVCSKCLIYDGFFRGGGSWAPDSCPKCGGTDCTMYKNLTLFQKKKAEKLKEKMWQEKTVKK